MARRGRINKQGRLVIPADMRAAAGLQDGDEVVFEVVGKGELRLRSRAQAVKYAQELVARHVPQDRGLADELIADRRKEAAKEFGED